MTITFICEVARIPKDRFSHDKAHFVGIGKSVAYEGVKTTKQGYELVFGTNYLGPFLLTYLLIDLLKKSAPSQIINLSSVVHYLMLWNKLDFKMMINGETGALAYDASKMGNIMHARELAKRYKGKIRHVCTCTII